MNCFWGNRVGSHETTVLNVVEASDEIVAHGVTLFVERNSERITKIKVNYYQPMDGIENALAKSDCQTFSQPKKITDMSFGGKRSFRG